MSGFMVCLGVVCPLGNKMLVLRDLPTLGRLVSRRCEKLMFDKVAVKVKICI